MKKLTFFCLILISFFGKNKELAAQCAPDLTSPNVQVQGTTLLKRQPNGVAEITAAQFNNGSWDACDGNSVDLRIEKGPPSAQPPATTEVNFPTNGQQQITFWVGDSAGNWANKTKTINVVPTGNLQDFLNCTNFISVSLPDSNRFSVPMDQLLEPFYPSSWTYLAELLPSTGNPQPTLNVDTSHFLQVLDYQVLGFEPGNPNPTATCTGKIEVAKAPWFCGNDQFPPTAKIFKNPAVTLVGGTGFLTAAAVDSASFDYCSAVNFKIFKTDPGHSAQGAFSDTLQYGANEVGVQHIGFRVWDAAGNFSTVFATVKIISGCVGDILPPVVLSPPNMTVEMAFFQTVNLNDWAAANAAFGAPTAADLNCGVASLTQNNEVIQLGCGKIRLDRAFIAADSAGNFVSAKQIITVNGTTANYQIHLPKDFLPGDSVVDTVSTMGGWIGLHINFVDDSLDYDCLLGVDLVHRIWTITDFCDANSNSSTNILPRLDWNADGRTGDAFDVETVGDQIFTLQGNPAQNLGLRTGNYLYQQLIRYNWADTVQHVVKGKVFFG